MALNFPDIFAFVALYMLAMVYKRNGACHMRYMIATAFLMLGPGTGRAMIIYGGFTISDGNRILAAVNRCFSNNLHEPLLKLSDGKDPIGIAGITDYSFLQIVSEVGTDEAVAYRKAFYQLA